MKKILAASTGRISDIGAHLQAVHKLAPSGQYERSLSERSLVTEACFLKLFITLEEFLEEAFAHYLIGKMSTARWRPTKYAKPQTKDQALKMLKGIQRFIDWSTSDTVVTYADLYFVDGEPFRTPLTSTKQNLQDMKTVRNSTAHLSATTQASLEALYTRWTGNPKPGVTAYEMLMASRAGQANTFYGESERIVSAVISQIANKT